jgi:hypothetical protein
MEKFHFNDAVVGKFSFRGFSLLASLVFNYAVSIIQILTGIVWICKG